MAVPDGMLEVPGGTVVPGDPIVVVRVGVGVGEAAPGRHYTSDQIKYNVCCCWDPHLAVVRVTHDACVPCYAGSGTRPTNSTTLMYSDQLASLSSVMMLRHTCP